MDYLKQFHDWNNSLNDKSLTVEQYDFIKNIITNMNEDTSHINYIKKLDDRIAAQNETIKIQFGISESSYTEVKFLKQYILYLKICWGITVLVYGGLLAWIAIS